MNRRHINPKNREKTILLTCKKYNIHDYKINKDYSVTVNGDVVLKNLSLNKLPLSFERVTGAFLCSGNNLKTLKGAPKFVGRDFDCSSNYLVSLEHGPKEVEGYFNASYNLLRTMLGAPEYLGSGINLSHNHLNSFDHFPKHIQGSINIFSNEFQDMEYLFLNILSFIKNPEYPYYDKKERLYHIFSDTEQKEFISWVQVRTRMKTINAIINSDE